MTSIHIMRTRKGGGSNSLAKPLCFEIFHYIKKLGIFLLFVKKHIFDILEIHKGIISCQLLSTPSIHHLELPRPSFQKIRWINQTIHSTDIPLIFNPKLEELNAINISSGIKHWQRPYLFVSTLSDYFNCVAKFKDIYWYWL